MEASDTDDADKGKPGHARGSDPGGEGAEANEEAALAAAVADDDAGGNEGGGAAGFGALDCAASRLFLRDLSLPKLRKLSSLCM